MNNVEFEFRRGVEFDDKGKNRYEKKMTDNKLSAITLFINNPEDPNLNDMFDEIISMF